MRYPIASIGPEAVSPVRAGSGTSPRDGTPSERSFAQLLAEAEAVQDHIEIRRRARGLRGLLQGAVQGAVQGASGILARQTPWLGLPLLMRRPAEARARRATR